MLFKKRLIEENYKLPAIAGLTGAGLGALYNYLEGGPAEELAQNQAEYQEFLNKEVPETYIKQNMLSKEELEDFLDNYQDVTNPSGFAVAGPGAPSSIIPNFFNTVAHPLNTLGDWFPGSDSDEEAWAKLEQLAKKHPELNIDINKGVISGVKVNPELGTDYNYNNIVDKLKSQVLSNPEEKESYIKSNPDIAEKNVDLQQGIEHATRNSYLKKSLVGAGLGAGGYTLGKFAKRKLDNK
jgi:hypothetical protein